MVDRPESLLVCLGEYDVRVSRSIVVCVCVCLQNISNRNSLAYDYIIFLTVVCTFLL
jgi:hypothetical protein